MGVTVRIVCDDCGFVHVLERRFFAAEEIWLVCHCCEHAISSWLCDSDLVEAVPVAAAVLGVPTDTALALPSAG